MELSCVGDPRGIIQFSRAFASAWKIIEVSRGGEPFGINDGYQFPNFFQNSGKNSQMWQFTTGNMNHFPKKRKNKMRGCLIVRIVLCKAMQAN